MPVFRRNIPCALWCLVLASSLAAPVVQADPVDAKNLFAQARGLRLQGQCASALPLFRRAYDVYPAGLGSLRNIAECEEELGHFASARRAWLDLQRTLSTNAEAKYEDWDQDAALAAARLASKVATLTIEVHAVTESGKPAQATGIHVSVNGEAFHPRPHRHAARPRSRAMRRKGRGCRAGLCTAARRPSRCGRGKAGGPGGRCARPARSGRDAGADDHAADRRLDRNGYRRGKPRRRQRCSARAPIGAPGSERRMPFDDGVPSGAERSRGKLEGPGDRK